MNKRLGPPGIKISLSIEMPKADPVPDLIDSDTCEKCEMSYDECGCDEGHSENTPHEVDPTEIDNDYYKKSMKQDKINNKHYMKGLL